MRTSRALLPLIPILLVACSNGPTPEQQQRVADLERDLASCRAQRGEREAALAERDEELAKLRDEAKAPRIPSVPTARPSPSPSGERRQPKDVGF